MLIEIDGAHSGIKFSACHFVHGHAKCSVLHGHTYIMRVRLEGEMGESGMVMDFTDVKGAMKKAANELDHKTLMPRSTETVKITESENEVEVLTYGKRYVFPREDVLILDVDVTTAEEMSRMLAKKLRAEVNFPKNVKILCIGLDEERGQTAWYSEEL
jgi:6-pyruvoyltetrahydropterin/6-carboxytetrahydropterin synthase